MDLLGPGTKLAGNVCTFNGSLLPKLRRAARPPAALLTVSRRCSCGGAFASCGELATEHSSLKIRSSGWASPGKSSSQLRALPERHARPAKREASVGARLSVLPDLARNRWSEVAVSAKLRVLPDVPERYLNDGRTSEDSAAAASSKLPDLPGLNLKSGLSNAASWEALRTSPATGGVWGRCSWPLRCLSLGERRNDDAEVDKL
mmetsp:Transcript_47841/g.154165  ORF Transcript_47841/g.154165 Transcript_47841/m.154165 type:complete len:204 (-) Transcript_47841:190-801(-)